MKFTISGLPIAQFAHILQMDDAALQAAGVQKRIADSPHDYPCRITLEDATPGEEVLLLNHAHQTANTPYAAAGPIYIRRKALATRVAHDEVPEQQRRRLLSVRAYDRDGWMVNADVTEGAELAPLIDRFFADRTIQYLHVHNARPGCYACRVDRA